MSVQTEFGVLQKVYIKPVQNAFIDQTKVDAQWEDLNFLGAPSYEKAIPEYQRFEQLLSGLGAEVAYFPENETTGMDSMYCRDASIVTDYGVILCRMGKSARDPEPVACRSTYEANGAKIIGEITAPGMVEGGDVAWLDEKTLAVAHGYRTNDEGFRQLEAILNPFGIEVMQVDLPHYKGESDVFHLMSIFSPVDARKAVVYSPYMPVRFRNELLERGYNLIEVPDEEFESMGCNVLAIAPSTCIMVEGNPVTKERIEKAGCIVMEYAGNEISVKGGGGPTCLTRPFARQ